MQNRQLGYEVVGLVDARTAGHSGRGMPVLGNVVDLPWIIEKYHVDEVIIGLPSSHQELVGIVSLCERERWASAPSRRVPDYGERGQHRRLGRLAAAHDREWRAAGGLRSNGMDVVVSAITLVLMSRSCCLRRCLSSSTAPARYSISRNAWGWMRRRSR